MQSESKNEARTIVDTRGIWCPPTPLIDLFKAWRKAKMGDLIELRATEPNIESDVMAWAKKSGNEVLGVSHGPEYTTVLVRILRRGAETLQKTALKASFNEPEMTRETPKPKLRFVNHGELTIGIHTLEPGWKWSILMKPIVKTNSCDARHVGYMLSGRMGFRTADGTRMEVGEGDVFDVHPGHDAWTVGETPAVFIDMMGIVSSKDSQGKP